MLHREIIRMKDRNMNCHSHDCVHQIFVHAGEIPSKSEIR